LPPRHKDAKDHKVDIILRLIPGATLCLSALVAYKILCWRGFGFAELAKVLVWLRWRGFGFAELAKVLERLRWRGFAIRAFARLPTFQLFNLLLKTERSRNRAKSKFLLLLQFYL